MTPLIAEMVKHTPGAELRHWFDIGKVPEYGTLDVTGNTDFFAKLPFAKCSVCGAMDSDGSRFKIDLTAAEGFDTVSVAAIAINSNGGEMFVAEPFSYVCTEAGLELHPINGAAKPPPSWQTTSAMALIERFLKALCATSVTAYQPKPKPSHINSKRAAKGKGPILFDWHTITIEPVKQKMPALGGTHASPRLHDRRGHWRKHPSGKTVWVKECKVGDAAKGVVFKDYRVPA